MSQDDDFDKEINEAIKRLFNEMMKDGKFPFQGKFSVMISGGRIPIDINQPKKECSEDCEGDCENECSRGSKSNGRYVTNPHGKKVFSYFGLSRMDNDIVEKTPHTEIYEIDGKVCVYADIPGSDMQNTAVSVHEDSVQITSLTGDVKYSAEVRIPKIKRETMKYRANNGVLEITADIAEKVTEQ